MANSLDQKLSDLSNRAKKAQDNVKTAAGEDQQKIQARGQQLRADANRHKAELDKAARDTKSSVTSKWSDAADQIQSHADEVRNRVQVKKDERNRDRVMKAADEAEDNAASAIVFALYSIEVAESMTLDAIAARDAADAVKAA